MLFKVSRTSLWGGDEKPCEGVVNKEYDYLDIRTLHSFEEFNTKYGEMCGEWLSKGFNHCINEKGYIQREFPSTGWFMEINSLEELIEFQNKYEKIIIAQSWENPKIKEIEICDDYKG